MTPAARVAAAIEVLDDILSGTVAEKALTGWGRSHRFAGSKDRAAIRDHVFQALRCRSSYAWIGGGETGRAIMLGWARVTGCVDDVFSGVGHAPEPLGVAEGGANINTAARHVRLDCPAWLLTYFDDALEDPDAVLRVLQTRAPVTLRVNEPKGDRAAAQAILAQDGIETTPAFDVKTALHVTENERRIAQSDAYQNGLVELQDASSQAAMEALGITSGMRVLDYCAGGGGKALAMAAYGAEVTAHDSDPRRMIDIAARAQRAGVVIETVETTALNLSAPFDLVLCDAPCSGSGTWRRTPAAKWALTPERLQDLTSLQDDILTKASKLVAVGGRLAYATCSVFEVENNVRRQTFMDDNSCFTLELTKGFVPSETGDGFFIAVMRRVH